MILSINGMILSINGMILSINGMILSINGMILSITQQKTARPAWNHVIMNVSSVDQSLLHGRRSNPIIVSKFSS